MLKIIAVRLAHPHCDDSRQREPHCDHSQQLFAGFCRREGGRSSLRPFPATPVLTAAILGNAGPHRGTSQQRSPSQRQNPATLPSRYARGHPPCTLFCLAASLKSRAMPPGNSPEAWLTTKRFSATRRGYRPGKQRMTLHHIRLERLKNKFVGLTAQLGVRRLGQHAHQILGTARTHKAAATIA